MLWCRRCIVVIPMSSLDLATLLDISMLPSYLEQVDQELERALASANPNIRKPAKRLILAPSKRLRPALVIAVAASQTAKINKTVISAAAAIELVHLSSLVHDDIIDESQTRWNLPTINNLEGSSQALVIGDFLLAKACEVAANISSDAASLVAATITELCNGQSQELSDLYNLKRSTKSLLAVINGKTAALFAAACQIGGQQAGLSPGDLAAVTSYGQQFGIAYQMIDDTLDLLSSPALMGKPANGDVRSGVYTLPILIALSGPKAKLVKAHLKTSKNKESSLVDLLINDGSIQTTILTAKNHCQLAAEALAGVGDNKLSSELGKLPQTYLNWSLSNLVKKNYSPTISNMLN